MANKQADHKNKVKELKKEILDAHKDIELKKHLIEYYEKAIPSKITPIILPAASSNDKSEHGIVIALLSDIHCEHKITKAQTGGINYYSPFVCRERLANYANNLVKLTKMFRAHIQLDTLIWGWLGDMLHGFIHEEYLRTNALTPIQAALFITEELRKVLRFVMDNGGYKQIRIVCKIGNHSRTTQKVYSDEEALHSYEWGIYQTLAHEFPGIDWVIEESYFTYMSVYNKVLRFHHGHGFKYMGGIGGIHIPLLRYISKVNRQRRADMDIIGHWHSRTFDATDGYLINGSVCGVDPYSIRLGFPIEPPTQQFQILDAKRGFTINAPIMVL